MFEQQNQQNQQNQSPQTSNKPGLSKFWWIILLLLMVWNLWLLFPRQNSVLEISYSDFISQISKGNVAQVKIAGSDISGVFVAAIQAPVTTPLPGTTPLPTIAATPTTPPTYQQFHTTFPEVVGDASLMALLQAHNVDVNVSPPPTPWFTVLLTDGLPILLLVVLVVWMGRQASRGQEGVFGFGRSKARRYEGEHTDVTFEDVAGEDEAKDELLEIVDFLRKPGKYHDIGARVPRGVLLVGPPGTGKTLLARAVAGEAGVPFFNLSASEFVEMFVGVGASRVRDLFEKAKTATPAIVFIDELDAIGRRRGAGMGTVNDEREQTLNQLLVEMDGFDERHEVIILAATNRPDVLDPALLRPGRFDRQITVGLPDRKGREGILRIHTRGLSLESDVNLDLLARTTTGFNGADLANLCNEAALEAARKDRSKVGMEDFEEALDRQLLGAARTLLLNDHDRKVVAYHEGGHALVAWLTPEADPVHKVTIIPRGRALGVTEQLPGDDQYNYTRDYLLARLAVMMGGRVGEEIAIGEITTGAENDLVEATRLARRMITRWGMGALGPMALSADEQQPFLGYEMTQGRDYSEETAARIDADVQNLLEERHQFVHVLLSDARDQLDKLANALLHDETIDRDEMEKVLGPRPLGETENIEIRETMNV
jgi:cell division protease FtsH